ncbi:MULTISPECIES: LysR family transcriptional regulator [Enterobacteriaceae]|uniref:LysR family transcriptional regulator n=1 Tax=Enterobacteriaceae TaxID=543 RepID=UPI0015DCC155|nr:MULTISPECIES: LysR family transcriptional regulator [Enterobacteriaceae]BBQ84221.1 transcriptional regulator [Klebsiella sp. WP3-W18-ESBL-02]BBR21227.1 transcriptional regulator [Klebsiella sp. WP3-S18-ESBL-05]
MHHNLRLLDLNLLLVFDALYRLGSVTEAASELAISPSAFSHALARLRVALEDPLFVRQDSQMQPTPRADALFPAISRALETLNGELGKVDSFDPATSTQTFTFAATDYTAAVFFPELIARLQAAAPGIRVRIIYSREYDALEDLLAGRVNFAVGFEEEKVQPRHGLASLALFTDDYVVAVRKGHPLAGETLTPETYLQLGHVVVSPWNEHHRPIDSYLLSHHVSRNTVVELPSVMSAPFIVSRTDLAITLPRRGVHQLFDTRQLALHAPPFPIPPYTLKVYYRPSNGQAKAQQWMLAQIAALK